jgi:hypothetical protein
MGTLMGTLYESVNTFIMIPRAILLRMINISGKIVEKISAHNIGSIVFFFFFYCLLDNVEIYVRSRQATDDNIWGMHIACWKNKVTKNTVRVYNVY